MRGWFVVVCAVLVAGCAEAPTVESTAGDGQDAPQTGDGLGGISGVVVDAALQPIPGANVTLVGGSTVFSDDEGRFGFGSLEPGIYFLDVRAARHLAVQTNAYVEPNELTSVRVQLEWNGVPDPYHLTNQFQGSITFHATVGWAQAEWMLDTYAGVQSPACSQCIFTFEADEVPDGHLFEATWEDNLQDPRGGHELYWSYAVPDPYQELFGYAPNPMYHVWGAEPFQETGDYKVMLLGDVDAVHVDQPFEIFLTQWFNAPVPDGWSIVQGTT